MRFQILVLSIGLALSGAAAAQQSDEQSSAASAPSADARAHLSTASTTIGDLLDDPAARAVLALHLPDIAENPQIDMARGMTLKDIQAYAPSVTDEKLAAIDADLAALPAQ